jgi:hypothetical protein
MDFTKVWFVHNNKIWNSLLHITRRTSSQGKELHVVKHVVFCSSRKEMSLFNSSWDFCSTMFSTGLVSQREIGIPFGLLTQFCVVPSTTFVDLVCSWHCHGISWVFCSGSPGCALVKNSGSFSDFLNSSVCNTHIFLLCQAASFTISVSKGERVIRGLPLM